MNCDACGSPVTCTNPGCPARPEIVHTLARVAAVNPDALRLAAQLLGVPPCPKCDYIMRPGHVCRVAA